MRPAELREGFAPGLRDALHRAFANRTVYQVPGRRLPLSVSTAWSSQRLSVTSGCPDLLRSIPRFSFWATLGDLNVPRI